MIKKILENKYFSLFITILILYSIAEFCIETLPDLSEQQVNFFKYSEFFVVAIFTAEYIARILSAENKIKFIFSTYGIIDLLAILPFYIAPAVDFRTIRILRLFRLFRILKLARYNKAMSRIGKALSETKEEIAIFTIAALFMLFIASIGIYQFEHDAQPDKYTSIFDCLWWSVATLTTVGYGEIYPITIGGKIFTFFILIFGLGLVAIPAGIVASSLTAIRKKEDSENGI